MEDPLLLNSTTTILADDAAAAAATITCTALLLTTSCNIDIDSRQDDHSSQKEEEFLQQHQQQQQETDDANQDHSVGNRMVAAVTAAAEWNGVSAMNCYLKNQEQQDDGNSTLFVPSFVVANSHDLTDSAISGAIRAFPAPVLSILQDPFLSSSSSSSSNNNNNTHNIHAGLGGSEANQQSCELGGVLTPSIAPLEEVMAKFPVQIVKGSAECAEHIERSIQSLDNLICEISKLDYDRANSGISTGFASGLCQRQWLDLAVDSFPSYQTLPDVNHGAGWSNTGSYASGNGTSDSINHVIPWPSPLVALRYLLAIKDTWNQRKAWAVAATVEEKERFCSCIGKWGHNPKMDVLHLLANQTLEALMVAEADECLRQSLTNLDDWDKMYSRETCPSPMDMEHEYMSEIPLRLLNERDEYIVAYLERVLAAESTIDICLCYIFARDPFVRYLLLDVLPFIAQQKNVRVRILIEQMVLEGETIKKCLERVEMEEHADSQSMVDRAQKSKKDADWVNSFRSKLPANCPPFCKAEQAIYSSVGLIREVLNDSSTRLSKNPIQIKYWFVRDKKSKYRIKSHVKCHIFDGKIPGKGMVIAGGSNFAPRSNSTDCDFLIGGDIAKMYQQLFDKMFDSMALTFRSALPSDDSSSVKTISTAFSNISSDTAILEVQDGPESSLDESNQEKDLDNSRHTNFEWTDPSCKALFLYSMPSSDGEDSILRCVLGAIHGANKSVTMSMGHSNVPAVMREALAQACARGVKVSLMMNSFYSCDLRNGQRDLFKSLMKLLEAAPSVELWVVTMPSRRQGHNASSKVMNEAPAFLHSKYVVVDSKWSAVGSWNLWTRAAFYEMEAEIFVHSERIAEYLEEKFVHEKNQYATILRKPEDCIHYHPTGCSICHQFGPFFLE